MSGYVYLLKCQDFYKIGIATDVHKRISGMQTGSPYTILLVASVEVDNPLSLEKELHAMYSHRHHRREWFALTEEDVDAIRSLFGAKRVEVEATPEPATKKINVAAWFVFLLAVLVTVAGLMLWSGSNWRDVFTAVSLTGFVFVILFALMLQVGVIKSEDLY